MRGVRGIAASVAGLLLVVAGGYFGLQLLGRTAEEAGQLVGLAVGLLAVLAAFSKGLQWLWRQSRPEDAGPPSAEQVDDLAVAVRSQWLDEATRRKLLAPAPLPIRWTLAPAELRGHIGGAVGLAGQPRRFSKLPGFPDVTEQMLRSGGRQKELHGVYGGLASGRIVITGSPGAGKTAVGILLLLDVLSHRAQLPDPDRAKVPVPVMFTLSGWNPESTPFETWLAQRMAATYFSGPSSEQQAVAFVRDGHVAAILDGLDEIDADLRSVVLEALSASQVRLVLLSRTDEMVLAAQQHRLMDAAVLQLCDVDAATAADYLDRSLPGRPPAHWDDLLNRLRSEPESPLARSLRTPLTLTLIRDTYRGGDDVSHLLDAALRAEPQAIEDHLLDRIVRAAYTSRPGEQPPAYSVDVAERTLSFIADRMSHEGTRDLAWWQLYRWAPSTPRVLVTALPAVLLLGVLIGRNFGAAVGVSVGLALGLFVGHAFGSGGDRPRRVGRLQWRALVSVTGLTLGLGSAVAAAVIAWLFGFANWLPIGLVFGFAAWLWSGLGSGLSRLGIDVSTPATPTTVWSNDQRRGLALALAYWLAFMPAFGLMTAYSGWLAYVSWLANVGWLAFGLAVAVVWPETYVTRLTFVQLAISYGLPVRLMRFLEDARNREVLRTAGPVYQFRHARLQDRLALQHQPAIEAPQPAEQ